MAPSRFDSMKIRQPPIGLVHPYVAPSPDGSLSSVCGPWKAPRRYTTQNASELLAREVQLSATIDASSVVSTLGSKATALLESPTSKSTLTYASARASASVLVSGIGTSWPSTSRSSSTREKAPTDGVMPPGRLFTVTGKLVPG